MKIPASKVPAQVWAEHAKTIQADLNDFERECIDHWANSKQVYRVNDRLWDEMTLADADAIPLSVFAKLPYDCLFIQHRETIHNTPLEGMTIDTERAGYFCWLEGSRLQIGLLETAVFYNYGTGRIVRDEATSNRVSGISIDLADGMTIGAFLDHSGMRIKALAEEGARHTDNRDIQALMQRAIDGFAKQTVEDTGLRQLLSILMYIVSKEADVRTVYAPQKNRPKRSKQTDCTVHEVGFRIAPALAEVRRRYESHALESKKTGRHMPVHVRRAHWHGYWTGPKENPTGLEIKWIAPIIVNADRGDVQGVVHQL